MCIGGQNLELGGTKQCITIRLKILSRILKIFKTISMYPREHGGGHGPATNDHAQYTDLNRLD